MNKGQKGFSVVELLLVVIIMLVLAAVSIPNLLVSKRAANEASALASMRSIHGAQSTYRSTIDPNESYAATLLVLGTAGLLDSNLGSAAGSKSGYTFVMIGAGRAYCATGEPSAPGTTGNKYLGVNEGGVIIQLIGSAAATCEPGAVYTPVAGATVIQ
jgi:type IV pilus assembly protein PilA